MARYAAGVILQCQCQHRKTIVVRRDGLFLLVRRNVSGNEDDAVKLETRVFQCSLRDGQMSFVDGVKSAAEQGDGHAKL